jgi:phosphatidate cytidylyltransferase
VAEDEGREEHEDLFEDLDKFFAPIQDVDWPEAAEPPEGRRPPEDAREEPQPAQPAQPAEAPEAEGGVEEVRPLEQAPGTEELFGTQPPTPAEAAPPVPGEAGRPAEPEERAEVEAEERIEPEPEIEVEAEPEPEPEPGPEESIEAFLFAGEDERVIEVGEAIEAERATRGPEAYVGLPTGEGEEEGVAEPIDEEPSSEEVQAAAEHFAESVREEVAVEVEEVPTAAYDTEREAGIEELLAGAEEEAPEGEEVEVPVRRVRVGAEALGGPSWQEPTAVEVGPEPEGGPGRNVQLAFLTGIVLAALAVGSLAIGPGWFAILAGIVVLTAQGELYFALQKRHYQPATALGLVAGALVLGAAYYRSGSAVLAVAALAAMASFLWFMTVPAQHRRNVVSNVGLTVLGIVWIPVFASYILAVLPFSEGSELAIAILGLTIVYDASAFAVGYFWGSRPLAPSISPKKSWEGAIGATLVVIAVAVGIVAPFVDLLDTIPRAVGLAVVVALFAPLGDLAESMVKRDLGIKDMGSILPGHGGVLDRIDAMLFVAPAAYLYLRLILS